MQVDEVVQRLGGPARSVGVGLRQGTLRAAVDERTKAAHHDRRAVS